MENPHDEQQMVLIRRVIHNVRKLNEVMEELNGRLADINESNREIATVSSIWSNYSRNALFHLETTGALADPK
ncbi:hypothetical protein BJ684DRAFT_10848 [Piptocephalis cylindrospora]|uniref:DASH complex subunit DAD4 n=1 Tax=Piptocephalis cylindrospora TaxID=1907219 RepID=A0A4P9Y2A5_9FUNG|nr:hypothetical protein BJ684DRAFT_10848 [Piptocephalis cylindrospora]|eukprot:RKP12893.1 hypothetical protein BJ684DRAFT_10848 [Piptocephalis cylindrospora]